MDTPLLLWVVGGILGFWVCFFLGSRTAYHPSTRWLRWSCVFAGLHFLFAALESPLDPGGRAVIPPLREATGLIAIACWHGWLVGVRGLARAEGIVRNVHLGVVAGYGLIAALASAGASAALAWIAPLAINPLLARAFVGGYVAVALSHIWVMTWRLHRRETIPVARGASRVLLMATTIVCASVIVVAGLPMLRRSFPEIAAPVEQAGYGLLCGGIALMGYGALTYVRRHTGRSNGRDYLSSGFASLVIVAVYESVLIVFRSVTLNVVPAHQALVLGLVLVPVIIATHFGFDQLRDMLDWLRVGDAARRVRGMLRTITRQIGSEKPRDQVIRDVLQSLAQGLQAERIAVFWFTMNEARLLAAYGDAPDAGVHTDDLRAARLQSFKESPGYEHLLPLCIGRRQRGALLIGGSGCKRWLLDERERLEAVGLLLADYIEHTASEPVTISQHVHRIEQQTRDVEKLHDALNRVHSPPVFITTLGPFRVEVDGKPASYKEGRIGRHMLNGMLMYLVSRAGKPVSRDALIEIARDHRRGRKPDDDRESPDRAHYISGLRKMLDRWGMADALAITDSTVTLKRHPSWMTDTDQVVELHRRAEQDIAAGQMRNAIALLEQALDLFHGDYLQEFDAAHYRIDHDVYQWERKRSAIEQRLLALYLDTPDLTDADVQQMQVMAHRMLTHNDDDPAVVALVERVARRCGDNRLLQRLARRKQ